MVWENEGCILALRSLTAYGWLQDAGSLGRFRTEDLLPGQALRCELLYHISGKPKRHRSYTGR